MPDPMAPTTTEISTTYILTSKLQLRVPEFCDTLPLLEEKLTALAHVVSTGRSIAIATNYTACVVARAAISVMDVRQRMVWEEYTKGRYDLPSDSINWGNLNIVQLAAVNTSLTASSSNPEVLNRLYKTNKFGREHAVWFKMTQFKHRAIFEAMERIIEAEKFLFGEQGGGGSEVSATHMADLHSIDEILYWTAQVLRRNGVEETQLTTTKVLMAIRSAQQVLGLHRDMLRRSLEGLPPAGMPYQSEARPRGYI